MNINLHSNKISNKFRTILKENNIFRFLFYVSLILCSCFIILNFLKVLYDPSWCWDFKIFYFAPKIYFSGLIPYDSNSINLFSTENLVPYRYHPYTLYLFSFFNNWEFRHAQIIYNFIRIVFLFATLFIWLKYLVKNYKLRFFLILITTFGFKTLILDIDAGNISIFEIFFFTLATIFLLKNKVFFYFIIIIFLSTFKIQNIFYLFLPLFYFNKKTLYLFILSIVFLLIFNALWYYIINSEIEKAYLTQILSALDEQGLKSKNFGVLLLIKTFIVLPLSSLNITFRFIDYLIYFIWLTLITIPSLYILLKIKNRVSLMTVITFVFTLNVILTPRILEYQFFTLIVPAVFIIHFVIKNTILQFVVIAILCKNLIGHYQPIILAFLLFTLYLYYLYKVSKTNEVEFIKNESLSVNNILY